MRSHHEVYESKWIGISLELNPVEIDKLIERLTRLKSGGIGHFHFRTDNFLTEPRIADVEISMKESDNGDNMSIH